MNCKGCGMNLSNQSGKDNRPYVIQKQVCGPIGYDLYKQKAKEQNDK